MAKTIRSCRSSATVTLPGLFLIAFLGTPDEHKQHKLYPSGHGMFGLFYKQIRGDVLAWLDGYLGPV